MAKKPSIDITSQKETRKWASTHGLYIAGRAYADEADATAADMENKWGLGRLRLLVSPEWREKFDRQRLLYNQAIWHGQDIEEVRTQSQRMVKAWLKLDALATEVGHQPKPPEFIEATLEDGTVVRIVPDNTPTGLAQTIEGRKAVVYTASEIARLLTLFPAIAAIKEQFPGATVEKVREVRDPLDAFDSSRDGLDAPFQEDSLDDLFGI